MLSPLKNQSVLKFWIIEVIDDSFITMIKSYKFVHKNIK